MGITRNRIIATFQCGSISCSTPAPATSFNSGPGTGLFSSRHASTPASAMAPEQAMLGFSMPVISIPVATDLGSYNTGSFNVGDTNTRWFQRAASPAGRFSATPTPASPIRANNRHRRLAIEQLRQRHLVAGNFEGLFVRTSASRFPNSRSHWTRFGGIGCAPGTRDPSPSLNLGQANYGFAVPGRAPPFRQSTSTSTVPPTPVHRPGRHLFLRWAPRTFRLGDAPSPNVQLNPFSIALKLQFHLRRVPNEFPDPTMQVPEYGSPPASATLGRIGFTLQR